MIPTFLQGTNGEKQGGKREADKNQGSKQKLLLMSESLTSARDDRAFPLLNIRFQTP